MDKVTLNAIVGDYIKAIEFNHFQDFCDRLLLKLYPEDYTPVRAGGKNGDMKNDGYCFINRHFFQAHASRGESLAAIKNKIETDLNGCLEKQKNVQRFIYLTNDTLVGEVEAFVDELRRKHPSITIETWGDKKLALKIINLDLKDISYVINRSLTTADGYSSTIRHEKDDWGIIEEIFNYIFSNIVISPDGVSKIDSSKLRKLEDKININFAPEHRQRVKQILENQWERKNLVEKFIQNLLELDSLRFPALKDKIQEEYCLLQNKSIADEPISDFAVFEKLAERFLPQSKKTNPEYVGNAKAIILYFFEFCDIGKLTTEEINKKKTIFD